MIVEVTVRVLDDVGAQIAGSVRADSIPVTPDIERNTLAAQAKAHALSAEALGSLDEQMEIARDPTHDVPPERGHGGGRR